MFRENRQIYLDMSRPGEVEQKIFGTPGSIGKHDEYVQSAMEKPEGVIRSMAGDTKDLLFAALTAPLAVARPPARFMANTIENIGHLGDKAAQIPITAALAVVSTPGVILAKTGEYTAKTPSAVTGLVAKGVRKVFRIPPKD